MRSAIFVIIAPLLLSACVNSVIPLPKLPSITRQEQSDSDTLSILRQEWQMLGRKDVDAEERQKLIADYNKHLLLLIRRLRHDTFEQGGHLPPEERAILLHGEKGAAIARLAALYDDIVPSADVSLHVLEERYTKPGIGVPMVATIPAEKVEASGQQFPIHTRSSVDNLTALLSFDAAGTPELELIPRIDASSHRIGRMNYGLAADFSAPIEVYWDLTHPADDRILGLLRPQKLRDTTGLSCSEPYRADRIPVILTHGLASSAETFANLYNRLRSDQDIRHKYQFWFFNYPSGEAWTLAATEYRRSIAAARAKTDPHHRNPNWDRMIVVGHSMGGLITQYSQCEQPWLLLQNSGAFREERIAPFMSARYITEPLPDKEGDSFREQYYFRPVQAGMVVYLATPHRGAPLAHYRIVEALTKLVQLPQNILDQAYNIITLQSDMILLHPSDLTSWFTSVNQLSPDSYSIRGLQGLAVRPVPTHSVIGNKGDTSPLSKSSDGVVPYWSSHIPWGTETVVDSGHSVQDNPDTAKRLMELLKAY